MCVPDGRHAQEKENHSITETCQCFGGKLDGGVALLAHVPEAVSLLSDAAADEADDAGPVDRLGEDVSKVSGHEDDQRFHVWGVLTPLEYVRAYHANDGPD